MFQKGGIGLPVLGDDHPTNDALECYSMGRLQGQELEDIEEHLLVCEHCQSRVETEDAFAQGMRAACKVQALAAPVARRPRIPSWRWAYGAVGVALLILIVSRSPSFRQTAPPAIVMLESTRGVETPAIAASHPLILEVDLTGVPQLAEYELQVVDASGHSIFRTPAIRQDNRVRGKLAHGLPRGAYFARLCARGDLLREFSLTVNP